MTDVLIYWRDFRQNWIRQFIADRSMLWHSNAKLLGDLKYGDRLWMVTSGWSIRQAAEQAGFLVAVWEVESVASNPDDDPAYSADEYRYRVILNEAHAIDLDPPVFVDHIVRPAGRDKSIGIGRFLQGPRKLSREKVRMLMTAAGPQMAQKWLVGNATRGGA